MQKLAPLAALLAAALYSLPGMATYPVSVVTSTPITSQVVPQMTAINTELAAIETTLAEIATSQAENAAKADAVASQTSQASRSQANFNQQVGMLEAARKSFTLPESICSESPSGVAAETRSTARATASKLSSGSGISNSTVKSRFTSAPPSVATDAYAGSAVHASYCTEADYDAYGGTALCESVGSYPGGDSQVRSLYDGAGSVGKSPDLSFSQDQIDAAQAYLKNTAKPSAGRTLGKGEATTLSGRAYIGLLNEYNALIDSAAEPQQSLIADSTPNEETKEAISEAIEGADSAKSYYEETASSTAQSKGYMSEREYEAFEVGRRYANTEYQTDLQEMDGDNLVREQIRVSSLIAWQLHDLKEQLRKNNVLTGQLLAVTAREAYEPRLQALSAQVSGGVNR